MAWNGTPRCRTTPKGSAPRCSKISTMNRAPAAWLKLTGGTPGGQNHPRPPGHRGRLVGEGGPDTHLLRRQIHRRSAGHRRDGLRRHRSHPHPARGRPGRRAGRRKAHLGTSSHLSDAPARGHRRVRGVLAAENADGGSPAPPDLEPDACRRSHPAHGRDSTGNYETGHRRRFGLDVSFSSGNILYEAIAAPVEGVGHFEPLATTPRYTCCWNRCPRAAGYSLPAACAVRTCWT